MILPLQVQGQKGGCIQEELDLGKLHFRQIHPLPQPSPSLPYMTPLHGGMQEALMMNQECCQLVRQHSKIVANEYSGLHWQPFCDSGLVFQLLQTIEYNSPILHQIWQQNTQYFKNLEDITLFWNEKYVFYLIATVCGLFNAAICGIFTKSFMIGHFCHFWKNVPVQAHTDKINFLLHFFLIYKHSVTQ